MRCSGNKGPDPHVPAQIEQIRRHNYHFEKCSVSAHPRSGVEPRSERSSWRGRSDRYVPPCRGCWRLSVVQVGGWQLDVG